MAGKERQTARTKRRKRKEVQPNKNTVTAFTHADDDRWLPPQFVVGELTVRSVSTFDYQHLADGVIVDETTITPIANPTPELIRMLKEKSLEWQQQDISLAKRRGRKDGTFREKRMNKEYGVHLVREDLSGAFSDFCDEMSKEDQRLTTDRRTTVAELVKRFEKKGASTAGKGRRMARKPATKFAHLRKKMEKTRIVSKIGKKK